jgi:predicted nucleic acid-binding protein
VLLADTSVWIRHLRQGDARLAALLRETQIVCHAFVIGELACGNVAQRSEILALLAALPTTPRVMDGELLAFIEAHRLMRRGLGLVDMHLLASCVMGAAGLWTLDRRLGAAAAELGIAQS